MSSTQPKSFVFVLMPFDSKFNDIYKFGIKGAADEVGAYAERVDEQMYTGGILDRIFNQISKADVIVADMTGRNPNVFYEVGYAHALGKVVLLLTQNTADIPFDLKDRPHTVYGGQIDILRQALVPKLQWAITESRKQQQPGGMEKFSVRVNGIDVSPSDASTPFDKADLPVIKGTVNWKSFPVPIHLRNDSLESVVSVTHVYLFASADAALVPYQNRTVNSWVYGVTNVVQGSVQAAPQQIEEEVEPFTASPVDAPDALSNQYRIKADFPAVPPGAVEAAEIGLMFKKERTSCDSVYRLRLHSPRRFYDFRFRLAIEYRTKAETKVESPGDGGQRQAGGD
jgi:hypothetical protein